MSDLPILKHNGQRILTTQQLAEIYETTVDNIKKNRYNNRKSKITKKGKTKQWKEKNQTKEAKAE